MAVRAWKNVSGYRVAGVVDLGSSKSTCLIGAVGPWSSANQSVTERIRIVGVSQRRSRGVASGVVTDLEKAERTLRETIGEAEQMAGVALDDVVVSLNGAYHGSRGSRSGRFLSFWAGLVTYSPHQGKPTTYIKSYHHLCIYVVKAPST